MGLKNRYVLPTILIGLIAIAGFLAFSLYGGMREEAMKSCVWSLGSPIVDSFGNNTSESNLSVSSEWKTLGAEESGALLRRLVMAGSTDCGTFTSMQEGKDYWGNPIKIMLRQSSVNGKVEAKIWSNGADGKEATEDDIRMESIR